jgi:hypothetical protein
MKELLIYVYVSIVGMLALYMAMLAIEARPKAELNCTVAEISPDYSYADRQKCRLIRGHKL